MGGIDANNLRARDALGHGCDKPFATSFRQQLVLQANHETAAWSEVVEVINRMMALERARKIRDPVSLLFRVGPDVA
jgi:hypothetical protein